MSFADTLDALAHHGAVAWGLLSAAVLVMLLTPLVARIAIRAGAFDVPDRDRPRVHTRPIPRIGGLAIAVGILAPALAFVELHGPLVGVIIGIPVVAAIGLYDDLRSLSAKTKLLLVMAAALIPVIGYDMHLRRIGLPFVSFDIGPEVAIPLTLLWIALVANLVNLIDGMDALAAGIVGISSAALCVLAMSFGRVNAAVLAAIVCGATVGFLRHNYHPAKIFMGDSGALTLGFVLGSLSVEGVLKTPATIALAAPLLIMAVPILDTSFVVAKRLKYKRKPWDADQNHFYHRFMRIGYSQRRTAAYLHVWAGVLAGYAMLVRFVPPRPRGIWNTDHALIVGGVGVLILIGSVWMVYQLEILKDRHFQVLARRRTPPPEGETEEAVEEYAAATPD
ncbi:MAG TPA: MraY family glycosyltransferase [Solirubrobacteraceae bacterium]|jgi:UDP-GlcNAc:undecaprenyl-phosphate GlcNAc-1-phosphate transferase